MAVSILYSFIFECEVEVKTILATFLNKLLVILISYFKQEKFLQALQTGQRCFKYRYFLKMQANIFGEPNKME